MSDTTGSGPMLAADGRPLKESLGRALRRQKLRALALIAPLLFFVLLTFVIPIVSMLIRSVDNKIVENTLPGTVPALAAWDSTTQDLPSEDVYQNMFFDLFNASEARRHTRLGSRLNYETTGLASLFRTSGRNMDSIGEVFQDAIEDVDPRFEEGAFWFEMMNGAGGDAMLEMRRARWENLTEQDMSADIGFMPSQAIIEILPTTAAAYTDWAIWTVIDEEEVVSEEDPWEAVYAALAIDLRNPATGPALAAYKGPGAEALQTLAAADLPDLTFAQAFLDLDEDWADKEVWETIVVYSPNYTAGYFLNAVDAQLTPEGVSMRPDNQQLYIQLFIRTLQMSLIITGSCILLGYPIAWLLANLPVRTANVLMILVLLPFWTSLLVRTSAWKVLLQQQGVINEILVWLGFVDDANRLILMNNSTGTIIAMTHILLPFMILPLYSVMKTIPPSYLRAAKSLGATNWTAFWRVYFPQSVPGIGAGSILVFILAIGYYITPEIVGGTDGVFISNRIAYHISSSLNWGLAAALGTILLVLVMALYWCYDRIVGIDNVKLGG
ncbi:putative spermidine/putrescine transport system permease protein [Loktanella sp. PT4BL]|jgi:putative spermidine/putrescine transport system permease protein|uniref:ABC transporter permease n=1 Tax=Loktanella sp. PT4BL TaxID=2135611 RepID=UPI000D772E0A|nr:ABC transporter permease [Loktanella sp. PT4BL]PXW72061.1 putative spermidine/putrescine transport system permease protein [Loktanella sp. PT4BL]